MDDPSIIQPDCDSGCNHDDKPNEPCGFHGRMNLSGINIFTFLIIV